MWDLSTASVPVAAVPATISIRSNIKSMVEINFLCVHKKLRSKRLTPLLIKVTLLLCIDLATAVSASGGVRTGLLEQQQEQQRIF